MGLTVCAVPSVALGQALQVIGPRWCCPRRDEAGYDALTVVA